MVTRRRGRRAAAVLLVAAAAGLVYRHLTRPSFDATGWQDEASVYREPYPRLAMADDLLRRGVLNGLSSDSLVRLLGPKPETEYFNEWDFVYWLGPERGLARIDSEWLVIELGADSTVVHAEIVRD